MADRGETAWNIPRLNLVFAVSSIALVISLGWMVWHDYDREWKTYQKDFRQLEIERADAAITKFGPKFEQKLAADSARIDEESRKLEESDKELKKLRTDLTRLNGVVFDTEQRKKFAKAEADALRYKIEQERLAKNDPRFAEATMSAADTKFAAASLAYDQALADAKRAESEIAERTKSITDARKALANERRELDLVRDKRDKLTSVVRQQLLNAPMLDFVKPSLEVKKVVLDDLFFPLNFTVKKRIDMCQTCHMPIDTAGYDTREIARSPKFEKEIVGRVPVADVFSGKDKIASKGTPITAAQAKAIAATSNIQELSVQLEQPLRSHPRLDLYLSSASPHPIDSFGCTVCHRGSGEALQFVAADHSPELYHAGVFEGKGTEAEKFAENEKLVEETREEWHEKYHWHKQHHWDFPMLPPSFTEASCLQCHRDSMETIAEDAPTLHRGWKLIEDYACYACHKIQGWRDTRKPGPTLEHIASKIDREFAFSWISNPKAFRPATRMPQIFHLENSVVVEAPAAPSRDAVRTEVLAASIGGSKASIDAEIDKRFAERQREFEAAKKGYETMKAEYAKLGRDYSRNVWDDVAVSTVVSFLYDRTAPFEIAEPPVKGDAEKGKSQIVVAGCLACHQIGDGPTMLAKDNPYAIFGPNLAGIASKVSDKWLYAWLKNPHAYWADTRMPSLRLADEEAANIAAYLSTLKKEDWKPVQPPLDETVLEREAMTFLGAKYSMAEAREHLKAIRAGKFDVMEPKVQPKSKLEGTAAVSYYVGERWITRQGCFSCHAIAGFEDTQAIGTELTEWGSKEVEKLDFGLLEHTYEITKAFGPGKHPYMNLAGSPTAGREPVDGLNHESRIEWLEQKLRAPRSYDRGREKLPLDTWRMPYFNLNEEEIHAIATYVIGLVKTGDVPDSRFARLSPRGKTLEDGKHLIRTKNCIGCHIFEMEKISFVDAAKNAFDVAGMVTSDDPNDTSISLQLWEVVPGVDKDDPKVGRPGDVVTIERSSILSRTRAYGGGILPSIYGYYKDSENKDTTEAFAYVPPILIGEGDKVRANWALGFLKEPYTIRPQLKVHMPNFSFTHEQAKAIAEFFPTKYGTGWVSRLTRMVRYEKHLSVEEMAKESRLSADNIKLMESGGKAAPDVLEKLFAFAKQVRVSVPPPPDVIEFVPEREEAYRRAMEEQYPGYFDKAIALTTPKAGNCFNCHFRGETKPTGQEGSWAPDFDRVRERLRPNWVYRWLEDPQLIYPGTKMPTLFPAGQDVFQEQFKAPREVQMGAIRDLLMNWDRYYAKPEPQKVSAVTEPVSPAGDKNKRDEAGKPAEVK